MRQNFWKYCFSCLCSEYYGNLFNVNITNTLQVSTSSGSIFVETGVRETTRNRVLRIRSKRHILQFAARRINKPVQKNKCTVIWTHEKRHVREKAPVVYVLVHKPRTPDAGEILTVLWKPYHFGLSSSNSVNWVTYWLEKLQGKARQSGEDRRLIILPLCEQQTGTGQTVRPSGRTHTLRGPGARGPRETRCGPTRNTVIHISS